MLRETTFDAHGEVRFGLTPNQGAKATLAPSGGTRSVRGPSRCSEEHVRAVAARRPQSLTTATLENGVHNRSLALRAGCRDHRLLEELERRYLGWITSCSRGSSARRAT
jgi:hypothetical protein